MAKIPDSFTQNVVEIQRELFVYIYSLLLRRSDADDVLQETNVVLWAKRDEFQPGTNFRAWAYQIARWQVLAFRKRQGRDRHRFGCELIDSLADEFSFGQPQFESRRSAMESCLDQLEPRDRELLEMRYGRSMRTAQIAESIERPLNAVYRTLYRIRTNLVQCIERKQHQGERS